MALDASQTRTVSVTTSYTALSSLSARKVSILNSTGVIIYVRKAAETSAGQEITLKDGQTVALNVVANAAEIELKGASAADGVNLILE